MAEVTEADQKDAETRVGTSRGRHFQPKPPRRRPRFRLPGRDRSERAGHARPAPPPSRRDAERSERPERRRRRFRLARRVEWAIIIAAAVITALAVKAFLLQAFYIPSASMEPTLERNDRVLVNKLSYKLHDVHRGDVVVFERLDHVVGGDTIRDLIKRVIALPGETIETREGEIYINDRRLREPYLRDGTKTVPGIDKQRIPADHYWVMGDNRANSRDSRFFGPIPDSKIVGRAFVQIWPIPKFDFM